MNGALANVNSVRGFARLAYPLIDFLKKDVRLINFLTPVLFLSGIILLLLFSHSVALSISDQLCDLGYLPVF